MALIGGANLAKVGYSPGQIAALNELSKRVGRDVRVKPGQGGMVLRWDYPMETPGHDYHRQVGIKSTWRGMRGEWQILEPEFQKTELTQNEVRYVLPLERPHGEQIQFNPFGKKTKEGAAVGTYSYPDMPGRVGKITVAPLTKPQIERFVTMERRGKDVRPLLWKWGTEIVTSATPAGVRPKAFSTTPPSPLTPIFPDTPVQWGENVLRAKPRKKKGFLDNILGRWFF